MSPEPLTLPSRPPALLTMALETMPSFLRFFKEEDRNRETRPNAQKAPVPLWSPWGAERGEQHSPFAPRHIALKRLKRQKQARSLATMHPKKRFLRHWRVGADSTKGCGRLAGKGAMRATSQFYSSNSTGADWGQRRTRCLTAEPLCYNLRERQSLACCRLGDGRRPCGRARPRGR